MQELPEKPTMLPMVVVRVLVSSAIAFVTVLGIGLVED